MPAKPLAKRVIQGARNTYHIDVWARATSTTCADHAYGAAVIRFLRTHRCTGLRRLLATTTVDGKPVGFAESVVSFSGAAEHASNTAGNFQVLLEQPKAGSVTDLLNDGYRLPSGPSAVPRSDAHLATFQDRRTAVVDAWYLRTKTPANDPALAEMIEDVVFKV